MIRVYKKATKIFIIAILFLTGLAFKNADKVYAASTETYSFGTSSVTLSPGATSTVASIYAPTGEAFIAASRATNLPGGTLGDYDSFSMDVFLKRSYSYSWEGNLLITSYGIKMDGSRINFKTESVPYRIYSDAGNNGWYFVPFAFGSSGAELSPVVSVHIEVTNPTTQYFGFSLDKDTSNYSHGVTYRGFFNFTHEAKAVLAPAEDAKAARIAAEQAAQNASV